MKQYLSLLKNVLDNGHRHPDRTGHGRISIFSPQLRFDLSDGSFPLVTTRKLNPLVPIAETLLLFIRGQSNVLALNAVGVKIWDPWAVTPETRVSFVQKLIKLGLATDEQALMLVNDFPESVIGEIGPMYGLMWRCWPKASDTIHRATINRSVDELPSDFVKEATARYNELDDQYKSELTLDQFLLRHYYSAIDQLNELVINLKKDPFSSRHLVTAFSPEFTPVPGFSPDENVLLGRGSLMPCHFAFQCFVSPPREEGGKLRLSLKYHIRSQDLPVGGPANIAGYALLLRLLAHCTDMDAHELVADIGDCHIYFDQEDGVREQLERDPLPLPTLWLNPEKKDLFAFTLDDIRVDGYTHHDAIKYPIAV